MNSAKYVLLLLLVTVSCLNVSIGQRATISGQVVEVIDGSTFVMQTSNAKFKIRLQYIDPPESTQPLQDVVTKHLSSMILGKPVLAKLHGLAGETTIAKAMLGDVDLSMQMLRDGAAWYSVPESSGHAEAERSQYLEMERHAKAEKRGVWSLVNIRPAWELRVERERVVAENLEEARKAANEKFRTGIMASQTQMGMALAEFEILCRVGSGDYLSVQSTGSGQTTYYDLDDKEDRKLKRCVGTFSFDEKGRLVSMKVFQ